MDGAASFKQQKLGFLALAPDDPHQPSYGFDVWIIVLGAAIVIEIIIWVVMQ